MKIASITLRNFRRFGDSPTTVELAEDITALVGANGSGKTALLTALNRLFGTTQNMRTMRRSDFHLPPGGATDDPSDRERQGGQPSRQGRACPCQGAAAELVGGPLQTPG